MDKERWVGKVDFRPWSHSTVTKQQAHHVSTVIEKLIKEFEERYPNGKIVGVKFFKPEVMPPLTEFDTEEWDNAEIEECYDDE